MNTSQYISRSCVKMAGLSILAFALFSAPAWAGDKKADVALRRTNDKISMARDCAARAHEAFELCKTSAGLISEKSEKLEHMKEKYSKLDDDCQEVRHIDFGEDIEALDAEKQGLKARDSKLLLEYQRIVDKTAESLSADYEGAQKEFKRNWDLYVKTSHEAWGETFKGDSARDHHPEAVEAYFRYFGLENKVDEDINNIQGRNGSDTYALTQEWGAMINNLNTILRNRSIAYKEAMRAIDKSRKSVQDFFVWDPFKRKYEVQYLDASSSPIYPMMECREGQPLMFPQTDDQIRENTKVLGNGYEFSHWSLEREGEPYKGDKKIDGNLSVWLVKKEMRIAVRFYLNTEDLWVPEMWVYRSEGSKLLPPERWPTKWAHECIGWSRKPNPTRNDLFTGFDREVQSVLPWSTPNDQLSLDFYPVWKESKIELSFVDIINQSEKNIATRNVTISGVFPSVPVPQRPGYESLGWGIDGKLIPKDAAISSLLEEGAELTIQLVAMRKPIDHEVKFFSRSVETNLVTQIATSIGNAEKGVKAPRLPNIPGYEFKGWFNENNERYDLEKPVMDEVSLWARWEPVSYKVILHDGADAKLFARADDTPWSIETILTEPAAPKARDYCDFKGWTSVEGLNIFGSSEEIPELYTFGNPVMANIHLYAVWQKRHHTVNFSSLTKLAKNRVEIDEGELLEEPNPAPVRSHHQFVGWFEQDPVSRELATEPFDFSKPVVKNMRLVATFVYDENYVAPVATTKAKSKGVGGGQRAKSSALGGNSLGLSNEMIWVLNGILGLSLVLVIIRIVKRKK